MSNHLKKKRFKNCDEWLTLVATNVGVALPDGDDARRERDRGAGLPPE
jgi:hypothetical protein